MATTLGFQEVSRMLGIPGDAVLRGGRWQWFRDGNRASLDVVRDVELRWGITDASSELGPTGTARIDSENQAVLFDDASLTRFEQFGEAVALLAPVID